MNARRLALLAVFPFVQAPALAAEMAMEPMPPMADEAGFAHLSFDQFEGRSDGRTTAFRWDGEAWIGTDLDKIWLKSEASARGGAVEDGQHEILYDRAVSTYFDLQAGFRTDLDARQTRNWAAFGIQGLAPLFVDLEATAYASDAGHFGARLQASYDLLLTQRLILQPQAELNFYTKSDPARLVGAGLADIDAGLRLRWEVTRKLAPYLGVVYEGATGGTLGLLRRAGESAGDVRVTFGLRWWL